MEEPRQPVSLGAYLREQRQRKGLSIRQLAERARVDHAYLVRLEGGKQAKPSADILQRIADALDLDFNGMLPFIGVRPDSALPPVRTYFRRKLGVNADEAEVLAQLIEKYRENEYGTPMKGGDEDDRPEQPNQGERTPAN